LTTNIISAALSNNHLGAVSSSKDLSNEKVVVGRIDTARSWRLSELSREPAAAEEHDHHRPAGISGNMLERLAGPLLI
jgi:hypothetical protein